MVLVDANQERNYIDCAFPWPAFFALTKGLSYFAVRGIDKFHKLTADEWTALLEEKMTDPSTPDGEIEYSQSSADALGKKHQLALHSLGSAHLSVVKGNGEKELRRVSEASISNGNSTNEERAEVRNVLIRFDEIKDRLQCEQMQLSSNSRYVYARSSGHNVQLTQPDIIAAEVKWVLDSIENSLT